MPYVNGKMQHNTIASYEESKELIKAAMQELTAKLGRTPHADDYRKWWDENERWCLMHGLPRNPENIYK